MTADGNAHVSGLVPTKQPTRFGIASSSKLFLPPVTRLCLPDFISLVHHFGTTYVRLELFVQLEKAIEPCSF